MYGNLILVLRNPWNTWRNAVMPEPLTNERDANNWTYALFHRACGVSIPLSDFVSFSTVVWPKKSPLGCPATPP